MTDAQKKAAEAAFKAWRKAGRGKLFSLYGPSPEQAYLAATERAEGMAGALAQAILLLTHYGPGRPHDGPCTPESGCDGLCVEYREFHEDMAEMMTALAAWEGR